MHYPDSRWRPRCQGKSRDDVSGRILKIKLLSILVFEFTRLDNQCCPCI